MNFMNSAANLKVPNDNMKDQLAVDKKRPRTEDTDQVPAVKPPRPFTAYHIFFQLEREFILHSISPSENQTTKIDEVKSSPEADTLALPQRYQHLTLPPNWYSVSKRKKRKHRKAHGAIGFHDLSNQIAASWSTIDAEAKNFCKALAGKELDQYKKEMEAYKRLTGEHVKSSKRRRTTKNGKKFIKKCAAKPNKPTHVSTSINCYVPAPSQCSSKTHMIEAYPDHPVPQNESRADTFAVGSPIGKKKQEDIVLEDKFQHTDELDVESDYLLSCMIQELKEEHQQAVTGLKHPHQAERTCSLVRCKCSQMTSRHPYELDMNDEEIMSIWDDVCKEAREEHSGGISCRKDPRSDALHHIKDEELMDLWSFIQEGIQVEPSTVIRSVAA